MSRYGRIESGFWQSRKVRSLNDDGRYLMLYLLSCPHGNAVGCFVLHDGYISADTGWPADRVAAAFKQLEEKGLAERDEETLLTRICGWWGHNSIENANVAKHVIKEIGLLPDCAVKNRLVTDLKGRKDLHETVIETLSKGLGKPFRNQNLTLPTLTEPNLCTAGAVQVSGTVIKVGEPHELEKPITGPLVLPASKVPKRTSEEERYFLEFYSAYPKKQSKGNAIKAYAQVRKSGVSHETIMRGLDLAKKMDRRFRERQYTPMPAAWLRAGGFEDEAGGVATQDDWKQAVFG